MTPTEVFSGIGQFAGHFGGSESLRYTIRASYDRLCLQRLIVPMEKSLRDAIDVLL